MEKIWKFLLLFLYWSHLEPNFKKSPLRIRDISIYQWLTSYFRVVHYLWQYYTDDRCVLILHEYWQKTNRWHGVEVRKDPSSSSILELSLFSDPQRGHIWFTFCGLEDFPWFLLMQSFFPLLSQCFMSLLAGKYVQRQRNLHFTRLYSKPSIYF